MIRATLLLLALPLAALAEDIPGQYALPTGQAAVTATLATRAMPDGRADLDIAFRPVGQSSPVRRYETELTKQMHVIAITDDWRDFVHEHGDRPGPDGHFHVAMALRPAHWHVFADAVPAGLGQQVMRFDLALGDARPDPAPALTGLDAADGAYTARLDPFALRAGQPSMLTLHILRDGRPADDLRPFLGVGAHAILIHIADLTYVHVHAAAHEAGDPMPGMAMPMHNHADLPDAPLAPDLSIHVTPPSPGRYVLWIQFTAGGTPRTTRFVLDVT